jgi:tRNA threonylcarbamoyladenosine biosynthesis protein TsaE
VLGERRGVHYAARVIEVESDSPEETERIAASLAAGLSPGDVVLVQGELGSGKTTFVRGAARALGVEGPVTSPTYTIGHVVFVEWPQAGSGFLPPEKVRVRLQHVGETRRLLVLESDEKSLEKSIFTGADPRV